MPRRRLIWQIFTTNLVVLLAALAAVALYATGSLRTFYLDHVTTELEARARLLESGVNALLNNSNNTEALDRFCKDMGRDSATRVTVVNTAGQVLGDSDEDPAHMENHAGRQEIVEALASGRGASSRHSPTLGKDMVYVALRLETRGETQGVLRVSVPLTSVNEALAVIYLHIAAGGIVVIVLAAGMSWWMSRRLSSPLEEMKDCAVHIAAGELDYRCAVPDSEEIGGLAEAMNRMAAQLHDRLTVEVKHRNEMEAVLSSMTEGVLAVDSDEKIINVNLAATRFFGLEPHAVLGRTIQEAVRIADLQQFIQRTLARGVPMESEIFVPHGDGERHIQAHGNVLRDAKGKAIGALVVLNDVTHLTRLEAVRRDFVANVSHELKTPITSVKGFVETLQAGAIKDPQEAERFLAIIARQADRLNAIIEDLLTLAKIEQGEQKGDIVLEKCGLEEVLRAAVQVCEVKAAEKGVRIDTQCEPGLRAEINAPLLEQALVNLIDNAIKYSDAGSRVEALASRNGGEVVLRVRDYGSGIEKEHLDRIFERFYRVDKARSRKQGGTGLGLAIVKHIAQAHGGRVSVESAPAKGSTFSIFLMAPASVLQARVG
ncbi:MAG: PAS domain-containing protein [Planctomycetes bacterium]|nr:PAS domain-containing protein [Planctomycetota bacterium]